MEKLTRVTVRVSSHAHAELIRKDIIETVQKRTPIFAVSFVDKAECNIEVQAEAVGFDEETD